MFFYHGEGLIFCSRREKMSVAVNATGITCNLNICSHVRDWCLLELLPCSFMGYPLPEKNPVWLSDNFSCVQLGVINLQSAAANKGNEWLKMLMGEGSNVCYKLWEAEGDGGALERVTKKGRLRWERAPWRCWVNAWSYEWKEWLWSTSAKEQNIISAVPVLSFFQVWSCWDGNAAL